MVSAFRLAAALVYCYLYIQIMVPIDAFSSPFNAAYVQQPAVDRVGGLQDVVIEPEMCWISASLPGMVQQQQQSRCQRAQEMAVLIEWKWREEEKQQHSFMSSTARAATATTQSSRAKNQRFARHDNESNRDSHRAIFCGYKCTDVEYRRLRSASPLE